MARQLGEFESIREFLASATITSLVDLPFAILFVIIIYIVAGDLAVIPVIASLKSSRRVIISMFFNLVSLSGLC